MLMSTTCAGQKINNHANSLPWYTRWPLRRTWTRALRRSGMQKVYDGFMLDAVRVLSSSSCAQSSDDEQRMVVRYMVYLRLVIDRQLVVSQGQTVLDSCIRQIAEICMGNNIKIIEASPGEYPPLV